MGNNKIKTDFRGIYFSLEGKQHGKDKYICRDTETKEARAIIVWDTEWSSYRVEFVRNVQFAKTAVQDLAEFMEQLK